MLRNNAAKRECTKLTRIIRPFSAVVERLHAGVSEDLRRESQVNVSKVLYEWGPNIHLVVRDPSPGNVVQNLRRLCSSRCPIFLEKMINILKNHDYERRTSK
jgi:hypothetical protein